MTAVEVAPDSAAGKAGIQRGDVLVAVNGNPGRDARGSPRVPASRPGRHAAHLHAAAARRRSRRSTSRWRRSRRRRLDVLRPGGGRPLHAAGRRRRSGCAGRTIRRRCISSGCASRSSARSRSRSTARSIGSTGSSTGATRSRQALLPPLLLHFTLVFPQRPPWRTTRPMRSVLPLMYLPAFAADRRPHRDRGGRPRATARCSRGRSTSLDRAEPVYLFVCAAAALVVLARAFGEITSLTGRRQLRWIAWGTALGVGPFAFGYALPWALGVDPPLALQLTAVPLGLVPLTFASAIVRYRLRDVEVIIKRGARLHRVPRGERAALCRDAAAGRVRVRQRRRPAQLDRRRCWRRWSSCCSRSRSRRRSRTPSIACSIAIATTTAARSSPSRAT